MSNKSVGALEPTGWLHELEFVDGSEGVDHALSFTRDAFPMDSLGMFRSIKQTPLFIPIDALPITKTRVGNHLRRQANGDNTMYRNGFKDGVKFAEENHGIKSLKDGVDGGVHNVIAFSRVK